MSRKLREKAEAYLAELDRDVQPAAVKIPELKQLLHELSVHQVELEMQGDELNVTNEALLKANERYMQNFQVAPIPSLRIDARGDMIEFNDAARQLFGLSIEPQRKSPLSIYQQPQFKPSDFQFRSLIQRVAEGRESLVQEVWFQNRQGQKLRYEVTLKPLQTVAGSERPAAVQELLVFLQDRTEAYHARKEKEAMYRKLDQVLDSDITGYWEWNLHEDRAYYSPSWCRMLGYEPGELEGSLKPYQSLLHPADRSRVENRMQECLYARQEKLFYHESRFRHKLGHWVWVVCSGRLLERDAGGRPVLMAGCNVDVSRSHRAEEEGTRLLQILNGCNEVARIGHWEVEIESGQVYWSPVTQELHEVDDRQPGEPWSVEEGLNFYPTEERAQMQSLVEKAATGGVSFDLETTILTAKGNRRWVRVVGIPEMADGRCVRLYGMFQDIHTSKTTREALRQSEEKFRKFVENAYDIVYSVSPEGIFTYISPNWQDFMGEPAELAIGRSYTDYVHPEDVHLCRDYLRQVLSGAAKPEHPHYRVRRADGTWRWHISNGSQLTNDCGETIGYVGIAHDNTERKQAEQKILQTNKALENAIRDAEKLAHEAQQANRAKSEFLANMSHEIRTPMNGVIGMTGLLLETELNPEQKQYAEIVRTSGESLLGLLNDILDFSKIEAGKVDLEAFDFNLEDLLDDCAASMAAKSYEQGLEIITVVDPAVPVHLVGDLGRLRQILNNLLGNALKFTEQGEICLRVSRTEAEDGPSGSCLLRFSVKDSGPGIPEHKRQLLFRQFSQLDASTTRKYGGTGLGLAISKQLAELMGGTIGVESASGRGSEFWFTARFGSSTGKAVRPQAPELAGIRVLLVDNCTTRRDSLQARLQAWGMQPATAADSDAARAQLGQAAAAGTPFSIVLIDAGLKGVSGEQLGREIKTLPEHKDCRLVLMAPLGAHSPAPQLLSNGFSAHLAKPLLLRDLFSVLVELMQLSPSEAARVAGSGNKVTASLDAPSTCKGRILLAEDNITNQQVALGILKKMGMKADAVANGLEVIEALRSLPYDLVLMDVQMPEMDGIAATAEIRNPQSGVLNPEIPIIAMTACAMRGDRERCLQAGMNDYLPKPISLQAVSEKLHKWLHLTPDHDAPAADGPNGPASAADLLPAVIWDGDDFLDRLLGDEAMSRQILDVFLSDLPPLMARLKSCLDASDAVNAACMTHSIKGMALTVGAQAVSDVAANIEVALQDSDFPQARMRFEELHLKTKATCGLMEDRSQSCR